jgi:V-type H+-transporting ATPase subunit H
MSTSLVSHAYLDDASAKIKQKLVPWEVCWDLFLELWNSSLSKGYQRAGLITPEELALIKKVDRQPKAKTESTFISDGKTFALLYLRLLKKLQRVDTVQCILVLIADALSGVFSIYARCVILMYTRSRRPH